MEYITNLKHFFKSPKNTLRKKTSENLLEAIRTDTHVVIFYCNLWEIDNETAIIIVVEGKFEEGFQENFYTVKKGYFFPVPSRKVTNQTIPGRE